MKKLCLLLVALVSATSFAQQCDNEWIQKIKTTSLTTMHPTFVDYFYAPTEEMVYLLDFGMLKNRDKDDLYNDMKPLKDTTIYQWQREDITEIHDFFSLYIKPNKDVKPLERPEANVELQSVLSTPYDTLIHRVYNEKIITQLKGGEFASKDIVLKDDDKIVIQKGGEYKMNVIDNVNNSSEANMTVLCDPLCDLVQESDSLTMHCLAPFHVFIGSGYPYADRISDYQNGEMYLSILNLDDKEIYADTLKLEASADSLLMEYVIKKSINYQVNSPKVTFKLSGPLLKEDIVIEKEAQPYFVFLNEAIDMAEELCDSIKDVPALAEYDKLLKEGIEAAKASHELTAYEQKQIDDATDALKATMEATIAAKKELDDANGIEVINATPAKKAEKVMKDGQIEIRSMGRKYNAQGYLKEK